MGNKDRWTRRRRFAPRAETVSVATSAVFVGSTPARSIEMNDWINPAAVVGLPLQKTLSAAWVQSFVRRFEARNMGMPGNIDIEITTTFDAKNGLVTRSVRFVGGWGLNSLTASDLGEQKWWHLNRRIVADTIELLDGRHKVDRQHVGPGHFDYKWMPAVSED